MPSWEITVYGRVQGVGFRRHVYGCALLYGIRGYVKNLSDGSVQIVALCSEAELKEFCAQVSSGSLFARVEDLQIVSLEGVKECNDFTIR